METILGFMSANHAELDSIFDEFKKQQRNDIDKAKRLFHNFKVGLQKHIVWEEEILFPIFEEKAGMRGNGPTAVMRMEHLQIKKFLDEIHTKLLEKELEGIDRLESDLFELFHAHNQKEENILYPAIDNLLTNAETEKAFNKMANISPDQYEKCCQ